MSFALTIREAEVSLKLALLRGVLNGKSALRLRGSDWFSWVTAGASNVVLLTTDTGVAEVLITTHDAWVLTDMIEAQRLIEEELPPNFKLEIDMWAYPEERESAVKKMAGGMKIFSDRPHNAELPLPATIHSCKRQISASEIIRYRHVGHHASAAMHEVLSAAQPEWSEYQLAGAAAEALWGRGLHPALTLAASARRLAVHRHPTATSARLGNMAMLVFCARGFGLYANLTRFVCFGRPDPEWLKLQQQVTEIEAQALDACQLNVPLSKIYHTLTKAYVDHGHANAINEHHQGGTTGYLAREIVAMPHTHEKLVAGTPLAWNPSLRGGGKIEDTFMLSADGLENLTFDANWPHALVEGRMRPLALQI